MTLMNAASERVVTSLLRNARSRGGVFLLSGEAGPGKTLLLERLAQELRNAGNLLPPIYRPDVSARDYLQSLFALTGSAPDVDPAVWLQGFREIAADRERNGRPAVLIFDDAEKMDPRLAAALPLLLASNGRSAVRLILSGGPGFSERLAALVPDLFGDNVVVHESMTCVTEPDLSGLNEDCLRRDDLDRNALVSDAAVLDQSMASDAVSVGNLTDVPSPVKNISVGASECVARKQPAVAPVPLVVNALARLARGAWWSRTWRGAVWAAVGIGVVTSVVLERPPIFRSEDSTGEKTLLEQPFSGVSRQEIAPLDMGVAGAPSPNDNSAGDTAPRDVHTLIANEQLTSEFVEARIATLLSDSEESPPQRTIDPTAEPADSRSSHMLGVLAPSNEERETAILLDRATSSAEFPPNQAASVDARSNSSSPEVALPHEPAAIFEAMAGDERPEDTPPLALMPSAGKDSLSLNSQDRRDGPSIDETELKAVVPDEIAGKIKLADDSGIAVDEGEPIQSRKVVTGTAPSPLESSPPPIEAPSSLQSTLEEFQLFLIRRGDQLLERRDVAGARLLYEQAASLGSAQAETALGKTLDPTFLKQRRLNAVDADISKAADSYRRASESGDAEARSRLRALTRKNGLPVAEGPSSP
jgi:type II secretory pathway predicted ATPase ExeA